MREFLLFSFPAAWFYPFLDGLDIVWWFLNVAVTDILNRPQWSYKKGLEAGVLPAKAYERDFDCDLSEIPSFSDLSETY